MDSFRNDNRAKLTEQLGRTRTQINLCFLSYCTEYDLGDSFPFDYEPNGLPFGS